MSNTKHTYEMQGKWTPGPWQVMYSTDKSGECALAVWIDEAYDGMVGSPICKVSPESCETEQDKANAQLIAASPELFEALINLWPYIQDLQSENFSDPNAGIFEDEKLTQAYNNAKAVIAKATGKEVRP